MADSREYQALYHVSAAEPVPEGGGAPERGSQTDWEAVVGRRRRRRIETWVWGAYATALAALLLGIYLYLRLEGTGPIWAFRRGRMMIAIAAGLTGFVGILYSVLFRPFLRRHRIQAFACLMAVIVFVNYPLPFPAVRESQPSAVRYRLPVDDEWVVAWGGDDPFTNRLARTRFDRRWGLDLVKVDEQGSSFRDHGGSLADYYAFGEPVVAPADGEVVSMRNDMTDNPPGVHRPVDEEFGNHIVLRVAEGEYVFLAHLQHGSIQVAPGEEVRRGQRLASVGNSGFSASTRQPHLAVHLQDSASPHAGQAVPWRFYEYAADGVVVNGGLPWGSVGENGVFLGQRVRHVPE